MPRSPLLPRILLRQALLLAFLASPCLADTPTAAQSALRLTWDEPNHPSGIYYVKDESSITVLVDNPAGEPLELAGELLFGSRVSGQPGTGELKILSVTPIATARIAPGQRAKIPLQLTFGAAGSYELRWHHGDATDPIPGNARDTGLECIFAPRSALDATGAEDSPWITTLPADSVRHPGLLRDYARQTTVRRFVVDERFAFDAARNVGLGFGASTGGSARQIEALLAEAAACKAKLTLRVTVPTAAPVLPADKSLSAFREYVADAIKRSQGTLAGLVIVPAEAGKPATDAQRRTFAAYYLAGYEAARKADRNVALLGAGSARLTAQWLADAKLAPYVDALAVADAVDEPAAARQFIARGGTNKKPLLLLPPLPGQPWAPPAAGLAAGAAQVAVPGPDIDHGVTAHLLGNAVFVQRLQITVPTADRTAPQTSNVPFVAVFQGDGYGVAAVAGFAAGTDLDALYPGLARTRSEVTPLKADDPPTYPNLQVGDDSQSMRVVDAAGAPVDCRLGDTVYVPAAEQVVYVLQGGTADGLASLLRVGTANRLPVFELGARAMPEGAALRLHNISTRTLGGTVRLIRPIEGQPAAVLAEKDFDAVPPDKTLDLPLPLTGEALLKPDDTVVVEVTTSGTKGLTQRTAVIVERAELK